MNLEKLKYPIGQCMFQEEYTDSELRKFIIDISTFPMRLENELQSLDETQLNNVYRENGWTVNQVVHHCADSHMNFLCRLKLALTEDNPTIKPYLEDQWANMADYSLPFNNSIVLLYAVHKKINSILEKVSINEWSRTYYHPEHQKVFRLCDLICLYAWHGNHHLAHITSLKQRNKWI
ncbi:MAG: putative metal-dependent hydrolase [Chitinophagaceae bacterium]|nr:putative metal-dependent hydrolase [Chitinophagaceae bacterium]